jgi:hypothetical protein
MTTGRNIFGKGMTVRGPGAGGGGSSGAHVSVTTSSLAAQLTGYGYVWPDTDWDDAGYITTYGAAGGGPDLDSSAVVFVVPASGRYRFTCYASIKDAASGENIIGAHGWMLYRGGVLGRLTVAAGLPTYWDGSKNDMTFLVSGRHGVVTVIWIGAMAAGELVSFASNMSPTNTNDQIDVGSFMDIEKIG